MHTILITCTRIGIAIPKLITSPHKTENAREQRGKELGWFGWGWIGLDCVRTCGGFARPRDFEITSQFGSGPQKLKSIFPAM